MNVNGFLTNFYGDALVLDAEQAKIDAGSNELLRNQPCVSFIGPLFIRFLKSFEKPIITEKIAVIMRDTQRNVFMKNYTLFEINLYFLLFTGGDVDSKIPEVLEMLKQLSLPEKLLFNKVLQLAKTIYNRRQKNDDPHGARQLSVALDYCYNNLKRLEDVDENAMADLEYPMFVSLRIGAKKSI